MDEPRIKASMDCYKAYYTLECPDYLTDVEADFIHTECDQICIGILRVLRELAPEAYGACVLFGMEQIEPPSARV